MRNILTLPGCTCQLTPAGSILVEQPPLGRNIAILAKLVIPIFLIRATQFIWRAIDGIGFWQQLGVGVAMAILWVITVYVVLSPVNLNFEYFRNQIIQRKTWFGRITEKSIAMKEPWSMTLVINSLRGTKQALLYVGDMPTEILSIAARTENELRKSIQDFIEVLQRELKVKVVLEDG